MFLNTGDKVSIVDRLTEGTNDLSNKDVLLGRVKKSFCCLRILKKITQVIRNHVVLNFERLHKFLLSSISLYNVFKLCFI